MNHKKNKPTNTKKQKKKENKKKRHPTTTAKGTWQGNLFSPLRVGVEIRNLEKGRPVDAKRKESEYGPLRGRDVEKRPEATTKH